ncbi:VOC family protein [Corynebacterium kroppenstedtii]|uniref:VOC family protein n=1 Tax=Corynebacterium sp. PCR 32 TaxID=3351342 RepID=UPI0030ADD2A9
MSDRDLVFIIYVSDMNTSIEFYTTLLGLETSFESPRYVTMDLAPGVSLALWTGESSALTKAGARTTEVCVNLHGGRDKILATYDEWTHHGVTVVKEPYDEVFGTTFVVADPDGNLIRVAPVD